LSFLFRLADDDDDDDDDDDEEEEEEEEEDIPFFNGGLLSLDLVTTPFFTPFPLSASSRSLSKTLLNAENVSLPSLARIEAPEIAANTFASRPEEEEVEDDDDDADP